MGILETLQNDPEKLAALRQGLLSAGAAMMAGGKQDFGTALGQGVGAGVKTYAEKFEEARKKALALKPYQAAMTPAKPAVPAAYQVGGQSLPTQGQAQDVAQNMYNLPQAANPYGNSIQQATAPAYDMPASLMPQGMGIEDLGGGQAAPIEEVAAQPAQAGGFDAERYFQEILNSGTEHPAFGEAIKYYSSKQLEAQKAKNPVEQFGKIMPHAYTPESLAQYKQSGNYADLKPIGGQGDFGKVNPGQFTPESLARYAETGQYGDLVPFRSPVQIDQGNVKTLYDPGRRTNTSYGVAPKPDEMPAFKAAQATAVDTAKAGVERMADASKKARGADTLVSYIDNAEAILKKGKAPGSLVGAGVTAAKGAAGYSDESTQDNKQLKLISGWMVSNVPRMEGPQSNYDVENYKQMAAAVGDSTTPLGDRLAALKQLRSLQEKYKTIQGGVYNPEEIRNMELQDALAKGDTQQVQYLRDEMRSMGMKENKPVRNTSVKDLPKKKSSIPAGWTVRER